MEESCISKKYLLPMLFLLISIRIQAQTYFISGKVMDSSGSPIPGVQVLLKNTTTGTITDSQGYYRIKATIDTNILIFSFMGLKTQEIPINEQSTLNVTLTIDDKHLDEVVVTAIGIERNTRALGYTIAEIKGNRIVNTRETNLITALSGKVAGVQINNSGGSPGGASTIRIRGNSSLLGNNSPLIIMDGIPVDNSTQDILGTVTNVNSLATPSNRAIDINSEDVELVTILKGPAAAALYGIRAANGAMLISTKRGSKLTNDKLHLAYTGSYTLEEMNRRLQPRQTMFSNGLNGQYMLPGQSGSEENWGALLDTLTYSNFPSAFDKKGQIVGQRNSSSNGIPVSRYDNIDNFFVKGTTKSNHLSIYGNIEKAGYYFSVGRLYQTGIVPTTDFYRTTFRFNGDYKVTDQFKIAGGINYINSGANNRALMGGFSTGVIRALINTPPNFDITNGLVDKPWANSDSYLLPANNAKPWGDSRSYANGRGWDNPYWSLNMNPQTDQVNRFISFAEANYLILPWVKSTFRYGLDSYTDVRKGGFSRGTSGVPTGTINDVHYTRRDYNTDFILTIAPQLRKDLNLFVLLGHNFYSSFRNQINTRGDGLIVPGNFNLSNASTLSTFNQVIRRQLIAGYVDIQLEYKKWVFLEITGRREWTSTLAKGKNSFFYPSLNTSWIFTDALGINSSWLSFGKVRASYAEVGNDAEPYSLETYYTNSSTSGWMQGGITFPFNNQAGLSSSNTLGNPDLKPEQIRTWEIGADLQFLRNRVSLEVVYYDNLSKDQIIPITIPSSTGAQNSLVNTGEISNKGVEFNLKVTPILRSKYISWDARLVFSSNSSRILSLAKDIDNINLSGSLIEIKCMVGKPYGILYGTDVKKNKDGQAIIDDTPMLANGQPNTNYGFPVVNTSFTEIGDPNPKFNAGFLNEFTYKNFAFSFFLDTRYGFDVFNAPRLQMVFNGVDKSTENRGQDYIFKGVKNLEGTMNDIIVKMGQAWYRRTMDIHGIYVEKDVYWLRLRDVNLTYSLPDKIVATLKISRASLTLTARNFLITTNYTGSDPDSGTRNGQINFSGLDFWTTPNTRSYSVSLNVIY